MSKTNDITPAPHSNDPNRDNLGRFTPGNQAAVGNRGSQEARRMREFREAILDAIDPEHVSMILKRLVYRAIQDGDVPSARVALERLCGPAIAVDVLERMATLEDRIEQMSAAIGVGNPQGEQVMERVGLLLTDVDDHEVIEHTQTVENHGQEIQHDDSTA